MWPQHFDAFVEYMGSVPSSLECHAAQAQPGEGDGGGGRWKEGRREGKKGTTGVKANS